MKIFTWSRNKNLRGPPRGRSQRLCDFLESATAPLRFAKLKPLFWPSPGQNIYVVDKLGPTTLQNTADKKHVHTSSSHAQQKHLAPKRPRTWCCPQYDRHHKFTPRDPNKTYRSNRPLPYAPPLSHPLAGLGPLPPLSSRPACCCFRPAPPPRHPTAPRFSPLPLPAPSPPLSSSCQIATD